VGLYTALGKKQQMILSPFQILNSFTIN